MPPHEDLYKELKRISAQSTPEEKLATLRHALLKPLELVTGIGQVLEMIDPYALTGLPEKVGAEEFDYWRVRLTESAAEMRVILDALTWDEEGAGM